MTSLPGCVQKINTIVSETSLDCELENKGFTQIISPYGVNGDDHWMTVRRSSQSAVWTLCRRDETRQSCLDCRVFTPPIRRYKTVLSCRRHCSHHRRDKTVLSRLFCIHTADATKQFCLVCVSVHIADRTVLSRLQFVHTDDETKPSSLVWSAVWTKCRQDCFVASAVLFTPPIRQDCFVASDLCSHRRRDKTVLSRRQRVHTADADETRQSCLVWSAVWNSF